MLHTLDISYVLIPWHPAHKAASSLAVVLLTPCAVETWTPDHKAVQEREQKVEEQVAGLNTRLRGLESHKLMLQRSNLMLAAAAKEAMHGQVCLYMRRDLPGTHVLVGWRGNVSGHISRS